MADDRRIINLYLDVELGVPVLSATDLTKDPERRIYWPGAQVLHRVHLLNHDGTYFSPPSGATWVAGINKLPVPTTSPTGMCVTENDDFNKAEDWPGANGVAPTSGRECWRTDCTDSKFKDIMAGASDLTLMYFCLWMNSPLVGYDLKCQWQIDVMPVAIDPSTATANPGIQHATLDWSKASFMPLWGDGYRFRARNKELSLHFPDDKWATLVPKIVDGKRTFDFVDDPED